MNERPQNWYLRGWVYEETIGPRGARQRKLVYQGERYVADLTPVRFRRLKLLFAALTLILCVLWLTFSLLAGLGSRTVYAGACAALALIPLIFHCMALYNLLLAEREMTFRHYYAAFQRMSVTTPVMTLLLAESFVGQAVFMLLHRGLPLIWWREWLWLAGTLVGALLSLTMFLIRRRLKFHIISGHVDTRDQVRKAKKRP